MSQSLSFIGGTGSIGFLRMSRKFKMSFPFWLAFNVRSNSIPSDRFPPLVTARLNEIQSQQSHQYNGHANTLNTGTCLGRRGDVCLFQETRDMTPYRGSWHPSRDPTRSSYYNANFPITSPKQISVNKLNTWELLPVYSLKGLR